ncbi:hypothetical protein DVH05_004868 [Phytophthora capsici]|nr:hypothetical protein DVH05_006648 [Phytophthora capsici]KAG1704839.1 hypothetical protein DVH05_004868 [Phytophthora capsici]
MSTEMRALVKRWLGASAGVGSVTNDAVSWMPAGVGEYAGVSAMMMVFQRGSSGVCEIAGVGGPVKQVSPLLLAEKLVSVLGGGGNTATGTGGSRDTGTSTSQYGDAKVSADATTGTCKLVHPSFFSGPHTRTLRDTLTWLHVSSKYSGRRNSTP